MKKFIYTSINEYATSQEYDRILQIRMDNIFDTIEEYKTKHKMKIEVSDVNFGAYTDFLKKHLLEIDDLVSSINKEGKIWHCDFPTFWVSNMDDLGEGPQIDELEIEQIPISIEYKYTHVYYPFEHKKRGFDYELEDRYKVTYKGSTDEWSSEDLLELMRDGAFHSEYGIMGLTVEDVKRYVETI